MRRNKPPFNKFQPEMKYRILIAVLLLLLMQACKQENFKPDRRDSRLPKYTERGNQVGGALINNVAWKTNYKAFAFGIHHAFYMINHRDGDSLTPGPEGKPAVCTGRSADIAHAANR
jgi:hypothetical protein